jgi:ribonuclease P protein subunit POP4
MSITPNNVVRHEFIGLRAEITDAHNKSNVGLNGKIVDETYKTFVLETKKGDKTVFKEHATFKVTLPDKRKVEISGDILVARPWDRIKKKLSQW